MKINWKILRLAGCLVCCIFLISVTQNSFADSYITYTYNSWKEAVPIPDAYFPQMAIDGSQLGIAPFVKPTDIFVAGDKRVYILDSGTAQVIVLTPELQYQQTISRFTKDGAPYVFGKELSGIFVTDDGHILIADKESGQVIMSSSSGEIIKVFKKPDTPLYPNNVKFSPKKVLVDSSCNVYVLAEGLYYGAVVYNPDGEFLGFFGINKVAVNAEVLADYLWKKILNKEMREQLARYVPVEYNNMVIDEKNFIYTCTQNMLRKLNPSGKDVLRATTKQFGDPYVLWLQGKPIKTNFIDLTVEPGGIVTLLDATRGKLFQYDADCNLLYAFGGIGNQLGTFKTPVAVDNINGKLLVLDTDKRNITVFEPTDFAKNVRQAVESSRTGQYEKAEELWNTVIRTNSNYELAYIGIGKAAYNQGLFSKAMKYFKLGYDHENYSLAKREFRRIILQNNFGLIVVTLAFIITAVILILKFRQRFRIVGFSKGGKQLG